MDCATIETRAGNLLSSWLVDIGRPTAFARGTSTHLRSRPSVVIVLLTLAAPLGKPQAPPEDLVNTSLEELMNIQVTSVSKKEEKLSRAAAAIYVITRTKIQRSGATNVPNSLGLSRPDAERGAIVKPKRGATPNVTLTVAACFIVALMGSCRGGAQSLSEYQAKAAFLYNFARFVEWPADSPGDPFVIGILGEDPFRGALETTVKDKTVEARPVLVRRVSSAEAARSFQILFISASERDRLPSILDSLKGSAVLTVGETEGFASRGGVINFVIEDDRERFEVNTAAAGRARLKISSRLLGLARVVKERGHRG